MRIALNNIQLAKAGSVFAAFLILSHFSTASAQAQATTTAPSVPPMEQAVALPPASAAPVALTPTPSADVPAPMTGEKDDKVRSLSSSEDKISDSVKVMAKRLSSSESMTLDDLNNARQMSARIEALIDVEKRLNELEKLRAERESGGHSMADAVPASALSPYGNANHLYQPAAALPPPAPVVEQASFQPAMTMPSGGTDIVRIVGSAGRYSAIVKGADGQDKTVKVGATILDGGIVDAISTSGVIVSQNKTTHTLHVKNVETVYTNSP